jgi:hypothetical protein
MEVLEGKIHSLSTCWDDITASHDCLGRSAELIIVLLLQDSFLTGGPVGTMVDTGLSEKEFTEGPLRMDAESTFCHVASEVSP